MFFKRLIRFVPLIPLLGVFSFSGLNLSQDNRLLYSLNSQRTGYRKAYKTLVLHQLDLQEQQVLSYYPERVYYPDQGDLFFLQNRLGLFRGSMEEQTMEVQAFYPHFTASQAPGLGRLEPVSLSPAGNYVVYYRQESLVKGSLILQDLEHNEEYIVTGDFEPEYQHELVKWSPDSRFFCYSKDGNLYYFSIAQYMEGRSLLESAHLIARGSINSFNWGRDNSLYYISNRNIYRIHSTEIFALSFYDTPLQIGTVAGRLFVEFDGNKDRFWLSPDGGHVLVRKGEGNVFLYDLQFRDYNLNSQLQALPFVKLPVGSSVQKVLWSAEGKITMLVENRLQQGGGNLVFIYDPGKNGNQIVSLNHRDVLDIELSPDEDYVSLVYPDSLSIRDYQSWDLIKEVSIGKILHHHWKNDRTLMLFGEEWSGEWDMYSEESTWRFISQCDQFGFNAEGDIQIETSGRNLVYQQDSGTWAPIADDYLREPRLSSSSYRIFTERTSDIFFDEMVMIRKIDGYGTHRLMDEYPVVLEEYPERDRQIQQDVPQYFVHGSRVRNREVALVFDITSEDDGLLDVLNTLSDYGIRATFFVNGDFIRKYPEALKILTGEGHELGSLFYTHLDMSDRKYSIDKDFIIRGLARNEDEFYKASGQEVSTLWHAPWYFVNSDILDATSEINYTYISRDIDSLDWVGMDNQSLYADSSELVERIMELKKPGSIISMSIGVEAEREDYLHQKLDLIINGLLKQGYEIVDVSTIMENAR